MITPFNIYLVMQLDSIRDALGALAILVGAALVLGAFMSALITDGDCFKDRVWQRWVASLGALMLLVSAVYAFLPSSKTAAAMIVLPALANNETVREEAGELYDLAKGALRSLSESEEPAK